MSSRAQLRSVGALGAPMLSSVTRRLEAAGVEPCAERERDAALVLVAASLDEDLAALVRAGSGLAGRRVLVIVGGRAQDMGRLAWRLLAAGATDVLAWDEGRAPACAAAVAARLERWSRVDRLVASPEVRDRLVGRSRPWVTALRELVEVALLPDAAVLLSGESGTGKELAARLIHDLDPHQRKGELVLVDCTTVVPTLSGSEFFGHERGAFTDAVVARDGAFAAADGGTLFLDELGDLPLSLQGELLRVIQEGTYKRIGSGVWRHTRFRLVCATHRDLRAEVAAGRFRADLFHRVAAWAVRLPPLRERTEDVPVLAEHLARQLRPDLGTPTFDDAVLDLLQRRDYPGNVRELRQLLVRLVARHVGPGPITAGDLPPGDRPAAEPADDGWDPVELERSIRRALARRISLRQIGRAAEEIAIAVALEESGGSTRQASLRLGVTDRALQLRRAAARKDGGNGRSG